MELNIVNSNNTKSSTISLDDGFISAPFSESLIHQVVVSYLANARQGTKAQKSRSEVSGGGKKPWRQKGTGRARAGTIRSPLWRHGGVTFAAKPRDYSQKINKKMYRKAISSIVSELNRQGRLIVVESFADLIASPSTKALNKALDVYKSGDKHEKLLLMTNAFDDNVYLSSRNLVNVDYVDINNLSPVSLIKSDKVLISADAVKQLEENLI